MWQDYSPLIFYSITLFRHVRESKYVSVRFGPLCIGSALGSAVSNGRWTGCGEMSLPKHGIARFWWAGERARAIIKGGLVLGRRGQKDRAGVAANQSVSWTPMGGPRSIVPAVLPQAVRQQGPRWSSRRETGAAGARGEWWGTGRARQGQPRNGEVVVLLHIVKTLDWDCWGSFRQTAAEPGKG